MLDPSLVSQNRFKPVNAVYKINLHNFDASHMLQLFIGWNNFLRVCDTLKNFHILEEENHISMKFSWYYFILWKRINLNLLYIQAVFPWKRHSLKYRQKGRFGKILNFGLQSWEDGLVHKTGICTVHRFSNYLALVFFW